MVGVVVAQVEEVAQVVARSGYLLHQNKLQRRS